MDMTVRLLEEGEHRLESHSRPSKFVSNCALNFAFYVHMKRSHSKTLMMYMTTYAISGMIYRPSLPKE